MDQFAPVVLFNFNRPDFTYSRLNELSQYGVTRVYFVVDGPREFNDTDPSLVSQVISCLRDHKWPFQVREIVSPVNLGLRNRFVTALDFIFSLENSAIILEDDCVVDFKFFTFATQALKHHGSLPGVGIISAHNAYPKVFGKCAEIVPYPRIWGWATWSSIWWLFRAHELENIDEQRSRQALSQIKSRSMRFLFKRMLFSSLFESSWDVRFAYFLLESKLGTLVPPINLVQNLGGGIRSTNQQELSLVEVPGNSKRIGLSVLDSFESSSIKSRRSGVSEDIRRLWRVVLHLVRGLLKQFSR